MFGGGGGLTAEVCSDVGVDADFDEDDGVDEAGYGGDDAAVNEGLVRYARSPRRNEGSSWGKRTAYNIPKPKILITPNFWLLLICSFLTKLAGKHKIDISSTISVTLEQTYITG